MELKLTRKFTPALILMKNNGSGVSCEKNIRFCSGSLGDGVEAESLGLKLTSAPAFSGAGVQNLAPEFADSAVSMFFICFYFIHFSRLNSRSSILFWENTWSASKNYQIFKISIHSRERSKNYQIFEISNYSRYSNM